MDEEGAKDLSHTCGLCRDNGKSGRRLKAAKRKSGEDDEYEMDSVRGGRKSKGRGAGAKKKAGSGGGGGRGRGRPKKRPAKLSDEDTEEGESFCSDSPIPLF